MTGNGPVAKIVGGKGAHYDICVIDMNIDIEQNTCSITLDENGKSDKERSCSYCYAKFLFKKDPNSYKVKTVTEKEFQRIKNKYNPPPGTLLRVGKMVECGSHQSREQLYKVIEYSGKYEFRPVVVSKTLNWDKRVADGIIETRGIIHISLGDDKLEPGAVYQGHTNRNRLARAIRYKRYGTPIQVRAVTDVTLPMNEFYQKALKYMGKEGILVTPLYYHSKSVFELFRQDMSWEEAKSSGTFTFKKGALHPNFIHDDWKPLKHRCGLMPNGSMACNNCVAGKLDFKKKDYKLHLVNVGWAV